MSLNRVKQGEEDLLLQIGDVASLLALGTEYRRQDALHLGKMTLDERVPR
jgi:hypothetical protein